MNALDETSWVEERPINMSLSGKIEDGVCALRECIHQAGIADIALDELMARVITQIR